MLFFSRYKAGKYDNSFYSFDAKRIGNAFFKESLPKRNSEIGRRYYKQNQDEALKNRELPPAHIYEPHARPDFIKSLKRWDEKRKNISNLRAK